MYDRELVIYLDAFIASFISNANNILFLSYVLFSDNVKNLLTKTNFNFLSFSPRFDQCLDITYLGLWIIPMKIYGNYTTCLKLDVGNQ